MRVLAAPCADPAMACDLDAGCIGAVVSYVGDRVDLTRFDQAPPPEYVADCVAPFALSEEVTSTIPQETLGAMIACDFELVTARFERDFAPGARPRPRPRPRPRDVCFRRAEARRRSDTSNAPFRGNLESLDPESRRSEHKSDFRETLADSLVSK